MKYRYVVVGAGMQGTAGAFDIAQFGEAKEVVMADRDLARAQPAASRINELTRKDIARAVSVDALCAEDIGRVFEGADGVFSATDYALNEALTKVAIEKGAHLVDLGGNTDVVRAQLRLHERALLKNVSIIPDCGLAPGLGNTLASYGISQFDECENVQIRCGGLPQTPRPPLGYKLVFNIRGLTNEYFGKAWVLRESKVTEIDTFSGLEELEFSSPVGKVEAFTTTGGTSTCPWTYQGKVKTYEYKTVRYLGHYAQMKLLMDLGFLSEEPISVNGAMIPPREVFHRCVEPRITFPNDKDLVVLRVECTGTKDGKKSTIQYELIDFHDERTGFTAMERTTAYPAALVLILSVRGLNKKGVVPLEIALDNETFYKELPLHGLRIKESRLS